MINELEDGVWSFLMNILIDNLHYVVELKAANYGIQKKVKVFFESKKDVKGVQIKYDGVPYIHIGAKTLACHQGKDKHEKEKEKYRAKVQMEQVSYDFSQHENAYKIFTLHLCIRVYAIDTS